MFWAQVDKNGPGGCWLWTGWTLNSGYGEIMINAKKITVHRLSYKLANGPIPNGMFVCHKCDVPLCVNPEHLFLGDNKANRQDAVSKRRHPFGENIHWAKLTEEKVLEIRAQYRKGKRGHPHYKDNSEELAVKYGVKPSTIKHVGARRSWKHLP